MLNQAFKKDKVSELIAKAKSGSVKALEELIRRVQKDIYAIFTHLTENKDDISDLTQEALLKMAKALPGLKDARHFRPWLNKIITNTFYDYTRKTGRENIEHNEKLLDELKDNIGCEPDEKCLFADLEKLIRIALLGLPHNLRITIVLREFEGMSYEDISKITNVPTGTVKSRISRAREKLQENLKEFI